MMMDPDVKRELPQRLLNNAHAHYYAGKLLTQEFVADSGKTECQVHAPRTVCLALSVELYLKLLYLLEVGKLPEQIHGLDALYKALSPRLQDQAAGYYKYGPYLFREEINSAAKAFIEWRYAHEHAFLISAPDSLAEVARALHRAARGLDPTLKSVYDN